MNAMIVKRDGMQFQNSPGEAKHKANMWLLKKIYDEVRNINKDAVIWNQGI